MKNIQIIFGVAVIVLLGFVAFKNVNLNLGGLETVSFYYDATNTSSTVPTTATTTSPILSLDTQRTNAIICNNGSFPVFLHQKGSATTTGVVVDEGILLNTSSTSNGCREFPGFKGYLFGITTTSTAVTVSEWK